MKYYLDITLLPDAEADLCFLWEKVYQQLHLALDDQAYKIEETIGKGANEKNVMVKKSKVGVSFPKYSQCSHSLSDKLRLLAMTETDLKALNLESYFERLNDYVHKTSIKEVPTVKITGYAFFKREVVKGNVERLARRRSKRLSISYKEAMNYFVNDTERKQSNKISTKMPFVYLHSKTWDSRFPLFIDMEKMESQTDNGGFSTYGLSKTSSVPLF